MRKNKISSLLVLSFLLHLTACICSFYLDLTRWPKGYKEINYWCNFLSYWSVQASLVTLAYFIYKLFKKSSSYFEKIFDLIVINANIISTSIFTVSVIGGWALAPRRSGPINIFSFPIDRKVFWWTYSIIWHYLAPILLITYFVRRKTSLASTYFGRQRLFWYSFLHPLFYATFVLLRPNIPGSEAYQFGSGERKSPYPYFFFDWVKHGKSNAFLWLLTIIAIICLGLLLFWSSTLFFWWYANHKPKANFKNNMKIQKNKKGDPEKQIT